MRLLSVSRPEAERRFVFVYILLACLTIAHSLYYAYGAEYENAHSHHPGVTQSEYYRLHNTMPLSADHPFYSGKDHAPDQYRIGVQFPARFIADKLSLTKYYIVFSVFDFFSAVATCWILYLLLCGSQFFLSLSDTARTVAVSLFLVSLAYPLFWAVPWRRPETLPTALYIAAVLLMLHHLRDRRLWLAAVLLATVWQGFVRAEVPLVFGVAVVLFSLSSRAKAMFGSRAFGAVCGLSIAAVAIAVQAYLKLWLFPQATYPPDTAVIQLFLNANLRVLITFSIAIIPYALFLISAGRYWKRLDSVDLLAVLASCLYFPVWLTVGIIAEVRIFVPFLLALTPTAAKLILLMIRGESERETAGA